MKKEKLLILSLLLSGFPAQQAEAKWWNVIKDKVDAATSYIIEKVKGLSQSAQESGNDKQMVHDPEALEGNKEIELVLNVSPNVDKQETEVNPLYTQIKPEYTPESAEEDTRPKVVFKLSESKTGDYLGGDVEDVFFGDLSGFVPFSEEEKKGVREEYEQALKEWESGNPLYTNVKPESSVASNR